MKMRRVGIPAIAEDAEYPATLSGSHHAIRQEPLIWQKAYALSRARSAPCWMRDVAARKRNQWQGRTHTINSPFRCLSEADIRVGPEPAGATARCMMTALCSAAAEARGRLISRVTLPERDWGRHPSRRRWLPRLLRQAVSDPMRRRPDPSP